MQEYVSYCIKAGSDVI